MHGADDGESLVRDSCAFHSMGCQARCIVSGRSHERNRALEGDVRDLLARIEKIASFYDPDSELNRLPRGVLATVSNELAEMLTLSQRIHSRTGGAFDITLGRVKALWDRARKTHQMPSASEIEQSFESGGMDKVELSPPCSMRILDPAVRLDLSGIAKGYAVDRGVEHLKASGASGGLLNLGGDLRVFGCQQKPSQAEWRVSIQDPRPGKGALGCVILKDCAIATSGGYERFATIEDEKAGHIFDPQARELERTGPLLSVTIASGNCAEADALATAVFAMGLEKGLDCLQKKFPELKYCIVRLENDRLRLYRNLEILDLVADS